jgi:TetR/AcrR family transcriptional regulator of autoinduction and epiphytic fitness
MTNDRRSYDATSRRARAEAERRATRRRVVGAARRLFVEKGYVATTIADIAEEAGVAIQSVYKSGRSKADLLHAAVDLAVAGDDEDALLTDRPPFAAIGEEPDAHRQVQMVARLIADVQTRSAPMQHAYRQAAAVDAAVAASLDETLRRRRETFATVIAMIPVARLRHPPDESVDTAWAIGSSEVFLLLQRVRGWDGERYRAWLTQTLERALLADD